MGKDWGRELATNFYLQIAILAVLIILYLLTKSPVFGLLTLIGIVGVVALEVKEGVKKHGWKGEFRDIAISLVAIVLLWLLLMFVLGTSVPLDAVVSCSMLPNIERGDLVVVQGSEPIAHELSLSEEEFEQLKGEATVVYPDGEEVSIPGSMYTYCAQKQDPYCQLFFEEPSSFIEKRGPFTFNYDSCRMVARGGGWHMEAPCITSVSFRGEEYPINFSHDTIVYRPAEGQLYSLVGDIIHRVYFKLEVDGETYYLTKGDNNPVLDIQEYSLSLGMGNDPPSSEQYKGKVIARIPYVGYLKLFLHGFFEEMSSCKTTLEF